MNAAPSFYFNRKASIFTMWWKLLNITSSEQIDKQISFIDTKYELSIESVFFSILVEYTCSFVLSGTHDKTCLKESHISSYYLLIHLGLYYNIYPYTLDANNSSQTCSITDLLYFFLAVPHFLYVCYMYEYQVTSPGIHRPSSLSLSLWISCRSSTTRYISKTTS